VTSTEAPTVAPLAARSGTYVLWLHLPRPRTLLVGRFGEVTFAAGYYAYVGSAFGPGGVRARLGRHLRGSGALRWHIDYLRQACRVETAWFSHDPRRLEHAWAAALLALPGARQPVAGFGASDCNCDTHLVAFTRRPALAAFRRRLTSPGPRVSELPAA
jgi:Uri superfamily endonuclease